MGYSGSVEKRTAARKAMFDGFLTMAFGDLDVDKDGKINAQEFTRRDYPQRLPAEITRRDCPQRWSMEPHWNLTSSARMSHPCPAASALHRAGRVSTLAPWRNAQQHSGHVLRLPDHGIR